MYPSDENKILFFYTNHKEFFQKFAVLELFIQ